MVYSAEPGRKTANSLDIRWRVVWQHLGMELPFRTIGMNLNIASSTACSIYQRFEQTGAVNAKREELRKLNS